MQSYEWKNVEMRLFVVPSCRVVPDHFGTVVLNDAHGANE